MCIICRKEYTDDITELNCDDCPLLQSIPLLPNLTTLDCYNCPLLQSLPLSPKLTELYCFNCPNLQSIPLLSELTYLDCSNCPKLMHCIQKIPVINTNSLYIESVPKLMK